MNVSHSLTTFSLTQRGKEAYEKKEYERTLKFYHKAREIKSSSEREKMINDILIRIEKLKS